MGNPPYERHLGSLLNPYERGPEGGEHFRRQRLAGAAELLSHGAAVTSIGFRVHGPPDASYLQRLYIGISRDVGQENGNYYLRCRLPKVRGTFKGFTGVIQGCGLPRIGGYLFGGPYNKDYNFLRSILGSPYFCKLPGGLELWGGDPGSRTVRVSEGFRVQDFRLYLRHGISSLPKLHDKRSCV